MTKIERELEREESEAKQERLYKKYMETLVRLGEAETVIRELQQVIGIVQCPKCGQRMEVEK